MTWLMSRAAAAYRILVAAVDLGGADGRASFAKLIIVAILVHTFVAAAPMPTMLAVVIIAAAFGRSMFLTFLNRGNLSVQDSRSVNINASLTPTQSQWGDQ